MILRERGGDEEGKRGGELGERGEMVVLRKGQGKKAHDGGSEEREDLETVRVDAAKGRAIEGGKRVSEGEWAERRSSRREEEDEEGRKLD